MRTILVLLTLAAAVITPGCSTLLSLYPFVTKQEAVFDPALVGVWATADLKDLFVIRNAGDASYEIQYESGKYPARLFRAGDAQFLDVTSKDSCAFCVAAHGIVRIWLAENTLRWAFVESDWIKSRIAEQQLPTHKAEEKTVVLTAPGAVVRNLLAADGRDNRAFSEVTELRRLR